MNTLARETVLKQLHLAWLFFAVACLGFLLAGIGLINLGWQQQAALHWAAIAGPLMAYPLIVLGRNLEKNYRKDEGILLPDLGLGNWVSLLRGMLVAGLAGFLLLPWPPGWLSLAPAALYGLCLVADALDGSLARRFNQTTRLGVVLDISFDGLGVLVASMLLVQYGQAPAWYLLVGLARYIFLGWEWALQRSGRAAMPLPRSMSRRIFAALQFIFMAVLLIPVFKPPLTWFAASLFALPFLISFGWDMLLVGGFVKPGYQPLSHNLTKIVITAQLSARLLVLGLAAASLWQVLADQPPLTSITLALAASQLLVALLVFLGLAARISSGIGLVLIGLADTFGFSFTAPYLLMTGYAAIVYLGSGPHSLLPIEEFWFRGHPENKPETPARAERAYETLPKTS